MSFLSCSFIGFMLLFVCFIAENRGKKTNNWYLLWRSKWKTRNKQLCRWQISSEAEVCAVGYASEVYWMVSIETSSMGEITDWLLPRSLGIDIPWVFFFFFVKHFKYFFVSCHVPLNFAGPQPIFCYYYYFITACKQIPLWKPILSSLSSHVHGYFPYVIFTTFFSS